MDPSDPELSADLPPSLVQRCGSVPRWRSLSSRNQKEVYLLEDAEGRRRIFKVIRGMRPKAVDRFLAVHRRLLEAPWNRHLVPVIAFGCEADVAWEEFPVADAVEPGDSSMESYSPLEPDRGRTGEGAVSTAWVATIGLGVVEALRHLDSLGLSHGDVKPGNLLRMGGSWVLADLDTVGPRDLKGVESPSTEGYRPPGGERGTGRDCYAVGKLLYELWTGQSRLEYPTLPRHLLTGPSWTRRDQLLNETLHALCSPLETARLRDLGTLRSILQGLAAGDDASLSRVDRLLRVGRRGSRRGTALVVGTVLLGMVLLAARWAIPRGEGSTEIGGDRVAWTHYRHPEGMNEGYVRRASDGGRDGWLMFNVHGSFMEPLQPGDRVLLDLKKDVWRGHVGAYLSDEPFSIHGSGDGFGHREAFGGLNHLMWFHLDGDSLVPPTAARNGRAVDLDPMAWRPGVRTNSLAAYHLELEVDRDRYRWTISAGSMVLATGDHPRGSGLAYLGLYAYDNTLCYLTGFRRFHPDAGSR